MFIGWSLKSYFFLDWKDTNETRALNVSKRVLSVFNLLLWKPQGQSEPKLVGMFIWWSSGKFMSFFLFFWLTWPKLQDHMWDIAIPWLLLLPVNFNILIFSETTGPIGINLVGKFTRCTLKGLCFLLTRSTQRKWEAQWCQKGCCLFLIFFSEATFQF